MRTVKKLRVPNVRNIIERELVVPNVALSRFLTGRNEEEINNCIACICPDSIVICSPGSDATEDELYHFNAQDDGGDNLFWIGLLANQGPPGAAGSSHYYFKSNSPKGWSQVYAIDEQATVHVSAYVKDCGVGEALTIGFFDQSPGTDGNDINLITSQVVGAASAWTFFEITTTSPVGTQGFCMGKQGGTISFDQITVATISSPGGPVCTMYSMDGDELVISGSNYPASVITSSLVASGSQAIFEMPSIASDVSGVWIDQLPTDEWDYDAEANVIILPQAVIEDSHILVRYIG